MDGMFQLFWKGTIAKWLRRQIRMNYLFLFEGAGSNPAGVDFKLLSFIFPTVFDLVLWICFDSPTNYIQI